MNFGNSLIIAALAGSISSFICYMLLCLGKTKMHTLARQFYNAATVSVVGISAVLMTMMLTDRFDIKYVHDFSSKEQPLIYKISGFWGGQEGSWLIWLTWISIIGIFLYKRAAHFEGPAMAFWSSLQTFFLIVLAQKSPFLPTEGPVTDGLGLNPLLQNYWMAIHPPILFAGFTMISVPAAFAVGALVLRDFGNWTKAVFGWAVAGWTVLGIGVLLGGFWAYETLGWGGWWGWDPVENASLVPWLLGGALVHGLMLERTKSTWKKLNLSMALACFVLVIYATFLTRSGVLGDFSVHSFAALGNLNWLIGFMVGYTVLAIGLVAFRTKSIDPRPTEDSISAKEFLAFIGIVMFGLAGLVVCLGMSSPLLSKYLLGKAGNVPIEYYYQVTTPIVLIMMAAVGLTPLVTWSRSRKLMGEANKQWVGLLCFTLFVGLAAAGIIWLRADAEAAARFAVTWFALAILAPNLWSVIDTIRRKGWRPSGGHVAHVGLSVFLLGMIISSHNNKANPDRLALETNKPVKHLGMTWTFTGLGEGSSDGKRPFKIEIKKPNGSTILATPTLQDIREGQMRHPFIDETLAGDLYIAPVDMDVSGLPPQVEMKKGETRKMGDYDVNFIGFSGMQVLKDGGISAGALLKVSKQGMEPVTIMPMLALKRGNFEFSPAAIPGTSDKMVLTIISVESKTAGIMLDGPAHRKRMKTTAIVEVTFKPMVWTLWLGAVIIACGGFLSAARRVMEARKDPLTNPYEIPAVDVENKVAKPVPEGQPASASTESP